MFHKSTSEMKKWVSPQSGKGPRKKFNVLRQSIAMATGAAWQIHDGTSPNSPAAPDHGGHLIFVPLYICNVPLLILRDWSLITGSGGATKREGGGHVKFYPYKKGGRKKVVAILKGGHNKFWDSFYTVA